MAFFAKSTKTQEESAPACEIVEDYGALGERTTRQGQQYLALRAVKWYGHEPQLDLRWWGEDGTAGKGVIFGEEHARKLYVMLRDLIEGEA